MISTARKQLKTMAGRKKIKNSRVYNTYHRPLSQESIDGDADPHSDM